MAKYPVELGDDPGQLDAINYLLSGAQGLGQNVQGFIGNTQLQQNGNNVQPFTSSIASLYINVNLATATWLDDNTLRFDFTVPEPVPPFSLGQGLTVSGTSVAEYNTTYTSVVVTTTTYVIVKSTTAIPNMGGAIGGVVEFTAGLTDTIKYLHTDCFGIVNVAGGQDIPVISAQLKNTFQYVTTDATIITYTTAINRYKLFIDGSFVFDATVAKQTSTVTVSSASTDYAKDASYFTAVKDTPKPGSYIYFLDTSYYDATGATVILNAIFDYRSLTVTVIKE